MVLSGRSEIPIWKKGKAVDKGGMAGEDSHRLAREGPDMDVAVVAARGELKVRQDDETSDAIGRAYSIRHSDQHGRASIQCCKRGS
jgi:hypothetical protein